MVETVPVRIAGELFQLEPALDPATRRRGLGGRRAIPDDGGMLFALPAPRIQAFVMRDCHVPIDVAFLDAGGRVVAIHAMRVEPPRRPGETASAYEARLRTYPSLRPAQFAVETAGGRLAEVGLVVGQRVFFDREAIARRAR